jgi:cytoskeleton protein RodZ
MSDIDSRHDGDDQPAAGVQPSAAKTAGTMLREARQAQGLHIAALSASIKVAQKKLEALEANRFDELPDATFTRALAQTVCRALKIDPVPVLALLPAPSGYRLEQVGEGINAPFRDRPGRHEPSDWTALARPAIWGPLLLLIAAAAVYFLPSGWLSSLQSLPMPQAASSPATAESTPGMTSSVLMAPPPTADAAAASAPGATDPAASSPISSAAPSTVKSPTAANSAGTETAVANVAPVGSLQVHAIADSWVEVRDARAKVLIARTVQAGESVAIDGQPPLRLKIGNARATEVTFRGQPLDMAANTLNNVARLELK